MNKNFLVTLDVSMSYYSTNTNLSYGSTVRYIIVLKGKFNELIRFM